MNADQFSAQLEAMIQHARDVGIPNDEIVERLMAALNEFDDEPGSAAL